MKLFISAKLIFLTFSFSLNSEAGCPPGYTQNHFGPCYRITEIKTPTPGYQVGDYLIGEERQIPGLTRPAGIQQVYRNGQLVGVETYIEGIQANYQPSQEREQEVPRYSTTYTPAFGGAYNPQTGAAVEEKTCTPDDDCWYK